MSPAERSQPSGPTTAARFDAVFGTGRVTTVIASLRAEVEHLHELLQQRQAEADVQRAEREALEEALEESRGMVYRLRIEHGSQHDALREAAVVRDHLRYQVMRRGAPDPMPDAGAGEHQREWTPGRPYLALAHCWHEGHCYRADAAGVPAGRVPGQTPFWQPCDEAAPCQPPPANNGPRRLLSVQDMLRTNEPGRLWPACLRGGDSPTVDPPLASPRALTHAEVLAGLVWLQEHLAVLWQFELSSFPEIRCPCPPHAYRRAGEWLADLPLYRTLKAEKTRRRLRFRPGHRPSMTGADLKWAP